MWVSAPKATRQASGSHLDLGRVPYVLYGVKYIGLVSLWCGFQPRRQIQAAAPCAPCAPVPPLSQREIHTRGNTWGSTLG